MHAEAKSLNDIGHGPLCSRLHKYLGEELFAVGAVELNFYKRILLLKTRDHHVGLFEIHRGIEDHFTFLFRAFDELLPARGREKLRGYKNEEHSEQRRQRKENPIFELPCGHINLSVELSLDRGESQGLVSQSRARNQRNAELQGHLAPIPPVIFAPPCVGRWRLRRAG